ncbi:hypothetical protein D5085_17175 [Ectothiorhodospiraceae bacterium BW-2]|nr:hypothetical protein D5085_17175 [Ectothiorhodospiraceae bacterium BW-2]
MKLGFRNAIALLFTLLLVATVTIVTLNGYLQARSGVLDLSTRVIDGAVSRMALRTNDIIQQANNSLELLALALQQHDLVSQQQTILPLLWRINNQSPLYQSVYLSDNQGNFLQARKHPKPATRFNPFSQGGDELWIYRDEHYQPLAHITKPRGYNPLERPWYQNTGNEVRPYWSDIYLYSSTKEPGITVSWPVLNSQGERHAVVAIDISLTSLNRFVGEVSFGEDAILLIVNTNDEVIAHPEQLPLAANRETSRLLQIDDLTQPWLQAAWQKMKQQLIIDDGYSQQPDDFLQTEAGRFFIHAKQITYGFDNEWYLFLKT